MNILSIDEQPDHLHVELAAATEMSFDLYAGGEETAIDDICRVAPSMLRVDGDLMEMYDDAGRTQPHREDLELIKRFLLRWRTKLKNCEVGIPGFPEH